MASTTKRYNAGLFTGKLLETWHTDSTPNWNISKQNYTDRTHRSAACSHMQCVCSEEVNVVFGWGQIVTLLGYPLYPSTQCFSFSGCMFVSCPMVYNIVSLQFASRFECDSDEPVADLRLMKALGCQSDTATLLWSATLSLTYFASALAPANSICLKDQCLQKVFLVAFGFSGQTFSRPRYKSWWHLYQHLYWCF